jgi:hypothetical protein
MRRSLRIPSLIWIPFVSVIGMISWAFLLAGLVLLAAVIVVPSMQEVKKAEAVRNDYQATLDLLDQKIAMQKAFLGDLKNPNLMNRLASRQLNINPKDQDILILSSAANADRSVDQLIKESLTQVTPKRVEPLPAVVESTVGNAGARPLFILVACLCLAVSFFVGVKVERR